MIRGTTPTFTLILREDSNVNLQEANNIYFTVSQGAKEITKTGADLEIADGPVYVSIVDANTWAPTFMVGKLLLFLNKQKSQEVEGR